MKRHTSILLTILLIAINFNIFLVDVEASSNINKAFIHSSASTWVKVGLTQEPTEITKVKYRIIEGSAHGQDSAIVSDGKFLDDTKFTGELVFDPSKDNWETRRYQVLHFNTFEESPTLSFEESPRKYYFQIYDVNSDVRIDTTDDTLEIAHDEDVANIFSDYEMIYGRESSFFQEDNGCWYFPNPTGFLYNNNPLGAGAYWGKIQVPKIKTKFKATVHTNDAESRLYYQRYDGSSWQYIDDISNNSGEDSFTATTSEHIVNTSNKLRMRYYLNGAGGTDDGKFEKLSVFAKPIDDVKPLVKKVMFSGGIYGKDQEIYLSLLFNEIVEINSTDTSCVKIPFRTNKGIKFFTYVTGSGTDTLVFKYSVEDSVLTQYIQLGNNDLKQNTIFGEDKIKDISGNGFYETSLRFQVNDNWILTDEIKIDGMKARVNSSSIEVSDSIKDKICNDEVNIKQGDSIKIRLAFDEKVKLLGNPTLTLNNAGIATLFSDGKLSTTHTFIYNVGSGEDYDIDELKIANIYGGIVVDRYQNTGVSFQSDDAKELKYQEKNIRVDNTKPEINIAYLTNHTTYLQSHQLAVTATDSGSGVKDNMFNYGYRSSNMDQAMTLYNSTNPLEISKTSSVTVYIKVYDNAGNYTTVQTDLLKLDKSSPAVYFIYPDTQKTITVEIRDSYAMMQNHIKCEWLNESDNLVDTSDEDWDNTQFTSIKDISYDPSVNGRYKLRVTAIDNAGNQTVATSNLIYIDKLPPTLMVLPSNSENNQSAYNIQISSEDLNGIYPDGAVDYIEYKWDDESDFTRVSGSNTSFNYDNGGGSGTNILTVRSCDTSGNISDNEPFTFIFDNTPPIITLTSDDFDTTISAITVTIQVTDPDNQNSISNIEYAFRTNDDENLLGSDWTTLGEGVSISKNSGNGVYYVHVKARDSQGNEGYQVSNSFTMDTKGIDGSVNIVKTHTNNETITIELDVGEEIGVSYVISEDGTDYSEYSSFAPQISYTFNNANEGTKTIYIKYKDQNGNITSFSDSVILDKTPPIASLTYSPNTKTNQEVWAKFDEVYDAVSGQNLTLMPENYIFSENGTKTFIITDQAGNVKTIEAVVDWIDRVEPTVGFLPNGDIKFSKTKTVVLSAAKTGCTLNNQYRIVDKKDNPITSFVNFYDGDSIILDYNSPVYVEISSTDELGNNATEKSNLFNVDNVAPVASISYSPNSRTASNVQASITFEDSSNVTVTGGNTHTFIENGEYTFHYVDEAGNNGSYTCAVDFIDRSVPAAIVTLSSYEITNEKIEVTVSTQTLTTAKIGNATINDESITPKSTQIRNINDVYEAVYEVEENGLFSAEIVDIDTGMTNNSQIQISNIDKTPPVFNYALDIASKTKENVSVTISYSDAMSEPVTIVSTPVPETEGKYIFTENGEYTFSLKDSLGNIGDYTVVIDNIDREINPVITYDIPTFTNQDVVATVSSETEEIFATNNLNSTSYTFVENGTFMFDVYDSACNTASITATVDWINKVGEDFVISPSTKEKTNQPITLTVSPQDKIATIQSIEELTPNEGTNNVFTVSTVGLYHFNVYDKYGNVKKLFYYVDNVDLIPPALDYTLGLNNIYGRVTINEGESIDVQSKSIRIDFSEEEAYEFVSYDDALIYDQSTQSFVAMENDTYDFIARDLAGNESSKTIVLTGIKSTPVDVQVNYSETSPTKDFVTVTLTSDEEFIVLNNLNQKTKVFTENGGFAFLVSDIAGNQREVTAIVDIIDKVPPRIDVSYSTRDKTKEDVQVTLSCNEPFYIINKSNQKVTDEYVESFSENFLVYYLIEDELGNSTIIDVSVDNIDKTPPQLTISEETFVINIEENDFNYMKGTYSNSYDIENITVDTSNVDINLSGRYFITYTAMDDVGNTTSLKKDVYVLDPNEPMQIMFNGKNPLYTKYFNSDTLEIEFYNVTGTPKVYYLSRIATKTKVKQTGRLLEGNVINIEKSGWYTIYLFDKDLNSKIYSIFISK